MPHFGRTYYLRLLRETELEILAIDREADEGGRDSHAELHPNGEDRSVFPHRLTATLATEVCLIIGILVVAAQDELDCLLILVVVRFLANYTF